MITPLNLLKVKKHELEMMRDRKYKIDDVEDIDILNIDMSTITESILSKFMKDYNIDINTKNNNDNKLSKQYVKIDENTGKNIYMNVEYIFSSEKHILKDSLTKAMLSHVDKLNSNSMIYKVLLILESPLNLNLNNIYGNKNKLNIKTTLLNKLLVNPNKYMYVPKHTLLTNEEKMRYLTSNNIDITTLSGISLNDPISIWNDAIEGDVFKIEREFSLIPTIIQKSVIYRCVRDTTNIRELINKSKNKKMDDDDESVYY